MAPADKSTEVAEKQSNLPAEFQTEFEQDAGTASEGMGRDDIMIPRFNILQSLSPQAVKADPAFIKGAEPGSIINTVSNELHEGEAGIKVVPVAYRRAFIEWLPRDKDGGGFVADHGTDSSLYDAIKPDDKGGTSPSLATRSCRQPSTLCSSSLTGHITLRCSAWPSPR